jgi:hypothetical protein
MQDPNSELVIGSNFLPPKDQTQHDEDIDDNAGKKAWGSHADLALNYLDVTISFTGKLTGKRHCAKGFALQRCRAEQRRIHLRLQLHYFVTAIG